MKLLIGWTLLAFVGPRIVEPRCGDATMRNIHHEKEILIDHKDLLAGLAIDYHTNTVLFNYINPRFKEDIRQPLLECAYINLTTNEFNVIPGIFSCSVNAVDDQKHVIYLGHSDGVYEFDYDKKTAKRIDGINDSIWKMFFKYNLYYITYSDELYVFKDGRSERVTELAHTKVHEMAVNRNLDYYFTNSSGMFKLSKSHVEPSYLGDYKLAHFTADKNGNIYFVYGLDVYYIDENDNIERIADVSDLAYEFAIESDGYIIYTNLNSIIRLKQCNVSDKKNSNGNNNL